MNTKNNDVAGRSALKAGIWYTISNFLIKAVPFITTPIFTRIMTEGEIGAFSNIMSWCSILAVIVTFEIFSSVSIARFDYKDNLDEYISSSLLLGSLITFVFYICVLIFHSFFENLFMMDFQTINIVFIYLLVYPAIQMFQIRNQISYKYVSTIVAAIIECLLTSIVSLACTLAFSNRLQGRVLGFFVPSIIFSTIIYNYLMHKGKRVSTKYWKYAIAISFPLIFHLLAGSLLTSSDRIMISKICGTEYAAIYSVSYMLATIVMVLWNSMNSAWSPWAYDMMDKKQYVKLKSNSKPYFIFFLIVVFSIIMLAPEMLLILGGSNYVDGKYIIPPVMVGCLFQFVYSLYVNIEFYHKKQKNIAIGTIIAACINIFLNILLLPKIGYVAAAYTTLIGYISLYIIHFMFVKRLNCEKWYDTNFFVKILSVMVIMIPIFICLYRINMIRYAIILILICVFSIIVVQNIDLIKEILKNRSLSVIKEIKILDKMYKFDVSTGKN